MATKATKPVKKAEPKTAKKKTTDKVSSVLSARAFTTAGKEGTAVPLHEAIFGGKINRTLIAQAVRVYLANQREGGAATKTRGMVSGSTKKIFKQKGTGNARHGSRKAPIFVGGGVALGPTPRDYRLDLPQKMRQQALKSALASKAKGHGVSVITDISSSTYKTKQFSTLLTAMEATRRTLIVTGENEQNVIRAVRNLDNVEVMPSAQVHCYAVASHTHVVFTNQALQEVSKRLGVEK